MDIGKFIGSESLGLGVKAEIAFSVDDSTMFDSVGVDTLGKAVNDFIDTVTTGVALNAGLTSVFPPVTFLDYANVSYMSNDDAFRILGYTPSLSVRA